MSALELNVERAAACSGSWLWRVFAGAWWFRRWSTSGDPLSSSVELLLVPGEQGRTEMNGERNIGRIRAMQSKVSRQPCGQQPDLFLYRMECDAQC